MCALSFPSPLSPSTRNALLSAETKNAQQLEADLKGACLLLYSPLPPSYLFIRCTLDLFCYCCLFGCVLLRGASPLCSTGCRHSVVWKYDLCKQINCHNITRSQQQESCRRNCKSTSLMHPPSGPPAPSPLLRLAMFYLRSGSHYTAHVTPTVPSPMSARQAGSSHSAALQ